MRECIEKTNEEVKEGGQKIFDQKNIMLACAATPSINWIFRTPILATSVHGTVGHIDFGCSLANARQLELSPSGGKLGFFVVPLCRLLST